MFGAFGASTPYSSKPRTGRLRTKADRGDGGRGSEMRTARRLCKSESAGRTMAAVGGLGRPEGCKMWLRGQDRVVGGSSTAAASSELQPLAVCLPALHYTTGQALCIEMTALYLHQCLRSSMHSFDTYCDGAPLPLPSYFSFHIANNNNNQRHNNIDAASNTRSLTIALYIYWSPYTTSNIS
jgi:hypothetical protein